MTPPAAAAAAPRTRTKRATPPPRRVSGPARGKQRSAATVVSPPPLALRLGGAVHGLAEHHYLDRLVRGRAWIGILAVGLMGIVFMQVSMLRMNAGIGAAVDKTSVLERQNSATRAAISELSSGDRIAAEAARIGLVLPPGTPRFLNARGADAQKAAAAITSPGVGIVPSMTTVATTTTISPTTPVLDQTSIAPTSDATTTQSDAPATTTTGTTGTTASTTTAAPATTDPAATQAQTPAAAPTTEQTAVAPPPTTSSTADTGGVDASGQAG